MKSSLQNQNTLNISFSQMHDTPMTFISFRQQSIKDYIFNQQFKDKIFCWHALTIMYQKQPCMYHVVFVWEITSFQLESCDWEFRVRAKMFPTHISLVLMLVTPLCAADNRKLLDLKVTSATSTLLKMNIICLQNYLEMSLWPQLQWIWGLSI